MDPTQPVPEKTTLPMEQTELPRPSATLLKWLKERLDDLDCGPDGFGEIWLVDDCTGEVLDRAAVRKRDLEEEEED